MRFVLASAFSALALCFLGCQDEDAAPICPRVAVSSHFEVHLAGYADELGDAPATISVVSEDVPVSASAEIGAWEEGAECRVDSSLSATKVLCTPRSTGVLEVGVGLDGPLEDLIGEHELTAELTQDGSTRSKKVTLVVEEEFPYGQACGAYNVGGSVELDVASFDPPSGFARYLPGEPVNFAF